jgi:hypothetical protein
MHEYNFRDLRLLLVAIPEEVQVGAHLLNAAASSGITARALNMRLAFSSNLWINRIHTHLNGRRPAHLRRFSQTELECCKEWKPKILHATGIAPLDSASLRVCRQLGMRT